MKDEDWQIRLQVPDILVGFGKKAADHLVESLKDDNKWVKVGAANVLGRLKSEDAVFPLIFLLEDQEQMVRDEAAVALSRINTERMIDPLLELLKHDTSYVREEAAWVLGEIKADFAVPSLIQALDDGDTGWMAAVSLGKIEDERATEHLKKKTADQDSRVGQAAAWALLRMKRN
jgi:HEAT repeat protein